MEDHASKNCIVKQEKTKHKSFNCFNAKINYEGHTTNSVMCPILQNCLKTTMNRTKGTAYRSDVPKNAICT